MQYRWLVIDLWRRRASALRGALALVCAVMAAPVEELVEAASRRSIVPIEAFVVREGGEPVVSKDWLDGQVAHANALFWPAKVGFEIESVQAISERFAHLSSRADRDALADHPRTPGRVHLFVVRRLDDVDVEGNLLYGVHWRLRRDRAQTWVIMSTRDESSTVLAHELGHLFELPHSRYPKSIMNKREDVKLPWPERVFAEPEIERIRRQARRHIDSGRLVPAGQP